MPYVASPTKTPISDWLQSLRRPASQWLQYLYFLRFPILCWFALPILCLVDGCTGVDSLTRGILTLSGSWQAVHAAFFVVALMMTVLICARNIVRNGRSRFRSSVPPSLRRALTHADPRSVLTTLAVAHIPALLTIAYVAWTTIREQESFGALHWKLWACLAAGIASAFLFWYLVSLFYLWTYDYTGKTAAALIFPVETFGFANALNAPQPRISCWIDKISKQPLRITWEGFAASPTSPLYELHSLTTIALGAFFLLYLGLYPLIAPVVVNNGYADLVLAAAILFVFAFGSVNAKIPGIHSTGRIFLGLILTAFAVFTWFLLRDKHLHTVLLSSAFPTIASILVILIFFLWFISGASFLLDRYRIPVLTFAFLIVFTAHTVLPVSQEHYFQASHVTRLKHIVTPREAIDKITSRISNKDEPFIIVTASGGGIQAAEWTAQVMAQLETRFRDDTTLNNGKDRKYLVHDHLLLASGVSGGSVGLMPYLLEYTAPAASSFPSDKVVGNSGDDLLTQRITRAPACSSLEAVAWGLEYYDLQRLILTVRLPWIQRTSTGDDPDRTWALTQSFTRNLNSNNYDCDTSNYPGQHIILPPVYSGEKLTLVQAEQRLRDGNMPAFTFNTTATETGGRFLLSNYGVPRDKPAETHKPLQPGNDFLPAESFLQAYTSESRCDVGSLTSDCYADISLSTAARLSATFPFVSSGTRIPRGYAGVASHFIDGGYFDNDGTASAIEFLESALGGPRQTYDNGLAKEIEGAGPNASAAQVQALTARYRETNKPQKLKILLIEIRDGDDLNPGEDLDDWNHQTGKSVDTGSSPPTPWATSDQLVAPLLGMWNAGHVSITRRNRRELCAVENEFAGDWLEVHHVVMGITAEHTKTPGKYKTAPLSWKLTVSQNKYIHDWATAPGKPTQQALDDAIRWVGDSIAQHPQDYTPCQVMDQTYVQQ